MTATCIAPERAPDPGRRAQWATRLIFAAIGLATAAWAPLAPYAKTRLGVDDAQFGLLLLCMGVGALVAMPLAGAATARFGCRVTVICGAMVAAAALPMLAYVETPWAMAVALTIFGASIGLVDVAMNVQAVIVERDSGRAMMSGFHALYSLGGMLGAGGVSMILLAGATPLAAASGFALLALGAALLCTPGMLGPAAEGGGGGHGFALPRGAAAFIGLLCFFTFLSEGAMLDWSGLFLTQERGFAEEASGYGYSAFAAAMTVGRFSGDALLTRFGGPRMLTIGGLLAATGFLVLVTAPWWWASLAGFLLVGFGASNIVPILFSKAGRLKGMSPSLAVAAVTTMGYAGSLAGPALLGFVAHAASLSLAFGLLAAAMLFVGLNGAVAKK